MKNWILIGTSILLIFISICIFVNKRVTPVIKNKKFEEEQIMVEKQLKEDIERKKDEKTELEQKAADNTVIEIPKPQSDGEIVGLTIGTYFSYINGKKYDRAYNLLYNEYKEFNFPTYELFEDYCKKTYTDYKTLVYDKFERSNKVLTTTVHIKSMAGKSEEFIQMFSIIEISENIYRISIGL